MPLIRYEIGDFAEVGDRCSCGRGLPVLRRILGRVRNMLTLPDGRLIWPSISDEGLQHLSGLQRLQELDLEHTAITDGGLTALEGLPKLEQLDLTGTQVTDEGIEKLESTLQSLHIQRTSEADSGE